MKRFQFSLESVQKLRLRQLETEESRLAPMYRELETIEETARQLQLELARETTRVADPAFAPRSFDLEILDRYRQFAARRTAQLTGEKTTAASVSTNNLIASAKPKENTNCWRNSACADSQTGIRS